MFSHVTAGQTQRDERFRYYNWYEDLECGHRHWNYIIHRAKVVGLHKYSEYFSRVTARNRWTLGYGLVEWQPASLTTDVLRARMPSTGRVGIRCLDCTGDWRPEKSEGQ